MGDPMSKRLGASRRDFVKGAAAAGATVFGMAYPWQASCAPRVCPMEFDGSKFQLAKRRSPTRNRGAC